MPRTKGSKTKKPNAYAGRSDRVRQKHGKKCYRRWGKKGGNPALLTSQMGGEVEVVQVGARGTGMSMYSAQHLIREVMANPGQTVYVNFELPKPLKEIIERYATVEKVKLIDNQLISSQVGRKYPGATPAVF